jgi:hypothetical protein
MSSNSTKSKLRPTDPEFWTILNELPDRIPVGKGELDAIDRYFSDVLDLVFSSKSEKSSTATLRVQKAKHQ